MKDIIILKAFILSINLDVFKPVTDREDMTLEDEWASMTTRSTNPLLGYATTI